MKCPKCGYHSFDYLASCKKCNSDLTAFKDKYKLRSLIFPQQSATASMEAEAPPVGDESPAVAAAAATTNFGYDFMNEETASETAPTGSLDLPTLDEEQAVPAEGTDFSWDENDQPAEAVEPTAAAEAASAPESSDGFDWNEADSEELAATEEPAAENPAAEDSLGLDMSWDNTAAAETEAEEPQEETFDPDTAEKLPEWNFEEEPAEEEDKPQPKKGTEEEPHDPFECRGPGAIVPAPIPPENSASVPEELSAEFLPSTADAPADPAVFPFVPPSLTSRSLALGVDLLLLALAILLFLVAGEAALAPAESGQLLPSTKALLNLAVPYFLVLFAVCFGYFTLFHFLTGQTPGKMLFRLRVETETGTPLAFSQAFLRSTGGLFSLLPLGIGFLPMMRDERRRGWNDRLAGTQVTAANPRLEEVEATTTEPE